MIFLLGLVRKRNAAEEGDILRRIVQKDKSALAELYDAYSKLVYSVVLSIVKQRDEAEDLLQEIFMQIWQKAGSFDAEKGNVYAWLLTISRNRAIDRLKSRSFREQGARVPNQDPDLFPGVPSEEPLDALLAQERAQMVRTTLEEITREQQEVIRLAFFGGHSQSQIAELLNIPLGTVKTRMRLGMKQLNTLMKKRLAK